MLTQGMLTQGTLFAVTISPAPLPWGRSTSAPAGDRTTCQELAGTWSKKLGRMAPNRALGALELTGGPFFAARSWDLWGDSKALLEYELRHLIGLRGAAGAGADRATSHASFVLATKFA